MREELCMQTNRWKRLVVAVLLSGVILSMGVSHALALQVGEKAPDFTLPGTTAEEIKLADYVGKKAGGGVLLHRRFYQRLNPGSAGLST